MTTLGAVCRGALSGLCRFMLLTVAVILVRAAPPAMADQAGADLAQRVYDRPDGDDVSSAVTMALTQEGKDPRVRTMILYRASDAGGAVSTLIRFLDPADIAGTGLLTADAAGKSSEQWIYLPAMKRERRVESSRKGGRFVNSDYYYEDLRDRKPSMDAHRLLGREQIDGTDCDVLESVPADRANSVYVRRLSWIDPESLLPVRVDFFERDPEKPAKRLLVSRRDKVQGYWTVMDSTLTDLRNGHATRLTVERIVYDRDLPENLFSTGTLADEQTEIGYRP